MNVFVCLPELRLKKAKINREIYVVSFASDLRGQSDDRPPAVGAANQTLTKFTPDLAAAMKFFVIAASNIFHRVNRNQPPQLGGDGIVLYPPADPNGMLALHVTIVESDAGARNQGKLLEKLFKQKQVTAALDALAAVAGAAAPVPANLVTTAMSALTSAIPAILESNGDDPMLDYNFSGREISRYHGSPEGTKHRFKNNKMAGSIAVYTD